jgi:hypothetical protein
VSICWVHTMKSWRVVAAIVVAFALGVAAALLLRDDDHTTSVAGAADRQAAPDNSAPSNPTSPPTRSPAPREPADAAIRPPAPASRIETTSWIYFAKPFQTVQIAGQYQGVQGPTELRVQLRKPRGWTQFPLPAVTDPSGKFRAFVELGKPGQYRLRIVDAKRDRASGVLTLLVF